MVESSTGPKPFFNFVVTGDSGVGKTKLVSRFHKDEFSTDARATVGVEFSSYTIDGETINTLIWDTAGLEQYSGPLPRSYCKAHGGLIVYDITDYQTYESVRKWLNILRARDTAESRIEDRVIMMVGNKCDLEALRVVTTEEAEAFAKEYGLFFTETSAKDSVNVAAAFEDTIREIHRIHPRPPLRTANPPYNRW